MSSPTRQPPFEVVAIDNQDVVRAGLVTLQFTHPDIVRSIRTLAAVPDLASAGPAPDVVVLDYWLDRDDSPSIGDIARLKEWGSHVLLYTSEERPALLRGALRAGVDGLCLKNDGLPALAAAIREVGQGYPLFSSPLARAALEDDGVGVNLTTREVEVLQALAMGLRPEEIARSQHVERSTVRSQIESVRAKYSGFLGAPVNSVRLVREAQSDGYVDSAPPRRRKHP